MKPFLGREGIPAVGDLTGTLFCPLTDYQKHLCTGKVPTSCQQKPSRLPVRETLVWVWAEGRMPKMYSTWIISFPRRWARLYISFCPVSTGKKGSSILLVMGDRVRKWHTLFWDSHVVGYLPRFLCAKRLSVNLPWEYRSSFHFFLFLNRMGRGRRGGEGYSYKLFKTP